MDSGIATAQRVNTPAITITESGHSEKWVSLFTVLSPVSFITRIHVVTALAQLWGPLRGASRTARETRAAESAKMTRDNELDQCRIDV